MAESYDSWVKYRDHKQVLVDDAWKAYAEVSGEPAPANGSLVPANPMKEVLQNMIPAQVELILSDITDFHTKLMAATANQAQLNRTQYQSFSVWLECIRSMIWPYLKASTKDLIRLDPIKAAEYTTNLTVYLKIVSPKFMRLETDFSALNPPEAAFTAGAAARPHSTINNLTIGASIGRTTTAQVYPLDLYGYGADNGAGLPPDFYGDVCD